MFRSLSITAALLVCAACGQAGGTSGSTEDSPSYRGDRIGYYGYGHPASPEAIAGWDIDVRPDGVGLPAGSGSVSDGEWLYEEQCAECHGSFGEGVGRYPVLAGGQGSLRDDRPEKTVGSYWPYTSTLFDYIRRTMPFTQPESLTADETYALTAYVLYLNDLVDDDLVLDQDNLPSIRLPNEPNFVPDPRPDVQNTRCMSDCREVAAITILSEALPAAPAEATVEATAAAAVSHPGQTTYEQYCGICHAVGVGGAPVVGDTAQWSTRLSAGRDALIANAINGTTTSNGVMPPKGGFVHLTDEQVGQAVDFMVDKSI